jgi:uncharacterized membrane protein (UPF0127 family)
MSGTRMRLRRTTDDAIVSERVSLGGSFRQRFLGLMGRAAMDEDEGLYLKTSSIHMMFMRFPIDALFVEKPDDSSARRVVAMRPQLPPWRGIVLPVRGAEGVIELPAGTLDRVGVSLDDMVILEPAERAKSEVSAE